MKYIKHFKSFNESDSEYTKDFKTKMDVSCKELDRIIRVNHSVKGDVIMALRQMFMQGLEVGKLSKLLGEDFHKYYVRKFKGNDYQSTSDELIKYIKPERISNNRTIKYQGPDIESGSRVLVSDFTIRQTLDEMADENQDYMYFERFRMDKAYYEQQLSEENDPKEKESITNEYNTLEVRIFLMKAYQLGFSIGETLVEKIPSPIKTIFEYNEMITNYESGQDKSWFKDDDEKDMMKDVNEKNKMRFPDWEKYKEYFE